GDAKVVRYIGYGRAGGKRVLHFGGRAVNRIETALFGKRLADAGLGFLVGGLVARRNRGRREKMPPEIACRRLAEFVQRQLIGGAHAFTDEGLLRMLAQVDRRRDLCLRGEGGEGVTGRGERADVRGGVLGVEHELRNMALFRGAEAARILVVIGLYLLLGEG